MPENPDKLFETPKGIRIVNDQSLAGADLDISSVREPDLEQNERLLDGFDPEARVFHAREYAEIRRGRHRSSGRPWPTFRAATTSRGALFVYALIALTLNLGVLGLAWTWRDSRVIAGCFVITPFTVTWFFLRLRAWLNRSTYVYRLMSSLGEDAGNLSRMSVWRMVRSAVATFYS